MFGYVIADREIMTEEQVGRYRAYYCGLCRALRLRHGRLSRMTLTYDMTFLVLLLEAMYEPETESGEERCFLHPAKKHAYTSSAVTDYAADMNLVLAYQNCLDDWLDERRLLSRAEAAAMRAQYERCRERYPDKCAFIEARLAELAEIERRGETNPDMGAKCFGELMGELFVIYPEDDVWSPRLRRFGVETVELGAQSMSDAVLALSGRGHTAEDVRRAGKTPEELREVLTMLIGECTELFELLPIVQDAELMRNILYSGVWTRYNAEAARRQGKGEKAGES